MSCEFINELSRLKKSSAESVDNIDEFDRFNKYMHVCRRIENELREVLKKVNSSNEKTLILLCGSAGDGKSHLLSYLKHGDKENANLLEGYKVLNDATESDSPEKTSMETLMERLSEFNDYNIDKGNCKTILAINLGILNKFIESEYGRNFTELKKYVDENGILVGSSSSEYKENSTFQHITFSDYQMFSINEEGVKSEFLNKLFDKVFNDDNENPFNMAFLNSKGNCNNCKYCPIRYNYELLKEEKYRTSIINRIIEVIIKDKVLISTRDVLNFIYNIVVSPEFSEEELQKKSRNSHEFLEYYISCTTPMLLDEYKDISDLQNYMSQYDILKKRSDVMDEEAIYFNAIENVIPKLKESIEKTPYHKGMEILNFDDFDLQNGKLKTDVFKFIKRLDKLSGLVNVKDDKTYRFVRYIYNKNISNYSELKPLFNAVQKAVENWNGFCDGDYICFNNSNEHYWLLEKINVIPVVKKKKENTESGLYRFNQSIKLEFDNDDGKTKDRVGIDIDYHLYELINDINDGYNIDASDKNFHADFNGFVNRIIEFGNKHDEVLIVSKDNPNNTIIIKKDAFDDIKVKCKRVE